MDRQRELLEAIRTRNKKSPFNQGILTADRYVKTMRDCAGLDVCYRYAAKGLTSLDDVLRKSAKTLTYNNPEMLVKDVYGSGGLDLEDENGDEIKLPKNTLMVFRHILTSSRKDRDNDILHPDGADLDPKMLLLWQHVHTLPIGKLLTVAERDSKKISVISCIVDMNDLCHDAAVMVDNGMGRFSHGFRALDFRKTKEESNDPTSGGFEVFSMEVMEESLVSLPSNVDSDTEEVLLSMIEGGELKSQMMKSVGEDYRRRRPVQGASIIVPGANRSFAATKEETDEKQSERELTKAESGSGDCGCGGDGDCGKCGGDRESASEKAPMEVKDGATGRTTEESEVICPECGEEMEEGVCEDCGTGLQETDTKSSKDEETDFLPCPKCGGEIEDGACEDCGHRSKSITAEEAMVAFLSRSTPHQRTKMRLILEGFEDVDNSYLTKAEFGELQLMK